MTGITELPWGTLADGTEASLFTLTHAGGMQAVLTSYGAALVQLLVPDPDGPPVDMILGFDGLDGYLTDTCYFGSVIGRVANRIDRARFHLHGEVRHLDVNHGRHHLHGGSGGLHTRMWKAAPSRSDLGPALTFSCVSPDGDQGYPGELTVAVTYTLTERSLLMKFQARSDRTTPVNLTGHAYFNLSGNWDRPVSDHEVTIFSDRYLPTNSELIPTGEILPVRGTRFDLTRPPQPGGRMPKPHDISGYDTFYILDQVPGRRIPAARVHHPPSRRTLEVSTTQAGVQFYTGGGIPHGLRGKRGARYGPAAGLCLEAQGYPDAPNHPGFPSILLQAETVYEHSTEYHFPLP